MDVVRGNFAWDSATGRPVGPAAGGPKQYLDPEIAGEGTKVIMSDGTTVSYNPPPVNAAMFDYSKIKSIQHYFNRTDFHWFPIWLFHPELPDVIAKDAKDAFENYGVSLIEKSRDELAQYGGGKYRWKYEDWSKWRTTPYHQPKFDPHNPGTGKTYIPRAPDPTIASHDLIARVVAAMQGGQNEFLEKLLSAMAAASQGPAPKPAEPEKPLRGVLQAGFDGDERGIWEAQAKDMGLKVDGRWSLDRLKKEVSAAITKLGSEEELPPAFVGPDTA